MIYIVDGDFYSFYFQRLFWNVARTFHLAVKASKMKKPLKYKCLYLERRFRVK